MWFTIIILLGPVILIGVLAEVRRRKRINTNHDQHRPNSSKQEIDERPHYSMGEDIRGD